MICLALNTNNMIIYLLVGCLFQMGNIHTTPVPEDSNSVAVSSPADLASKAADKTKSMIKDGKKTAIDGVENVGDVLSKGFSVLTNAATDLSTEVGKSGTQIAQAGGRASLALGQLCSQLFDGLSATVATSSGYLASGVRAIDDTVGYLPVLGLVTGTLDAVTTHLSNAVNEMSTNGRKSRQKLFDGLREHLNRSSSLLASADNSSTDGEGDKSDTTSAAVKQ